MAKDAPNPPATRVVTLGTQGGPLPSRNRAQPANAVVVNGAVYLVDAGNGVLRQLTLAGLDYRRVSQIFITHNHDDHNADWGTLMGEDHPITWCQFYDGGRVWYTGLGHDENIYRNEDSMTMIIKGIKWAAGKYGAHGCSKDS